MQQENILPISVHYTRTLPTVHYFSFRRNVQHRKTFKNIVPHTEILLMKLMVSCYSVLHHPHYPLIAGTHAGTLPLRLLTGWAEPEPSTERATEVVPNGSSIPSISAWPMAPQGWAEPPPLCSLSASPATSQCWESFRLERKGQLPVGVGQTAPHVQGSCCLSPHVPQGSCPLHTPQGSFLLGLSC